MNRDATPPNQRLHLRGVTKGLQREEEKDVLSTNLANRNASRRVPILSPMKDKYQFAPTPKSYRKFRSMSPDSLLPPKQTTGVYRTSSIRHISKTTLETPQIIIPADEPLGTDSGKSSVGNSPCSPNLNKDLPHVANDEFVTGGCFRSWIEEITGRIEQLEQDNKFLRSQLNSINRKMLPSGITNQRSLRAP
eukprot:GHVP01000650.1.p1 GENE.GHVP01000650.1~~GHVP01000650.1.p1  ORF type:complete len:192 (-),score=26.68 GHVP01000650.1:158-733(-)